MRPAGRQVRGLVESQRRVSAHEAQFPCRRDEGQVRLGVVIAAGACVDRPSGCSLGIVHWAANAVIAFIPGSARRNDRLFPHTRDGRLFDEFNRAQLCDRFLPAARLERPCADRRRGELGCYDAIGVRLPDGNVLVRAKGLPVQRETLAGEQRQFHQLIGHRVAIHIDQGDRHFARLDTIRYNAGRADLYAGAFWIEVVQEDRAFSACSPDGAALSRVGNRATVIGGIDRDTSPAAVPAAAVWAAIRMNAPGTGQVGSLDQDAAARPTPRRPAADDAIG